jgi:hypothetical protein
MLPARALRPHVLTCLVLLPLTGCSDPYAGRMEVTGTVILEGAPLKDGSISFHPLDGQSTESGAPIVDGEYKVPREHGLKAGKYLVRLTAGDGKTPAENEVAQPGGSTNIVSFDRIPAEWGYSSKKEYVVKADGPNKFDVDIPKAARPRKR